PTARNEATSSDVRTARAGSGTRRARFMEDSRSRRRHAIVRQLVERTENLAQLRRDLLVRQLFGARRMRQFDRKRRARAQLLEEEDSSGSEPGAVARDVERRTAGGAAAGEVDERRDAERREVRLHGVAARSTDHLDGWQRREQEARRIDDVQ